MDTIPNTICWQKIGPWVFLCDDSPPVRHWLRHFPGHERILDHTSADHGTCGLPLAVRRRVGIDVFMVFKDTTKGGEQYSMLYIPGYVSRGLNLYSLLPRYPALDLEAFYHSLFEQLCLPGHDAGYCCPIHASFTSDFMGFRYEADEFLCKN